MSTPVRSRDAYRKHPKPRALVDARPEIVRQILDRIGKRGLAASGVARVTGMPFTDTCLYNLREGNAEKWSDSRLLLLGERLGLKARVTFR